MFSDRDSARWGLSAPEVERRRELFWDIFVADSWQSLATGRPPSITTAYIDCQFPRDEDAHLNDQGKVEPGCKLIDSQLRRQIPNVRFSRHVDVSICCRMRSRSCSEDFNSRCSAVLDDIGSRCKDQRFPYPRFPREHPSRSL